MHLYKTSKKPAGISASSSATSAVREQQSGNSSARTCLLLARAHASQDEPGRRSAGALLFRRLACLLPKTKILTCPAVRIAHPILSRCTRHASKLALCHLQVCHLFTHPLPHGRSTVSCRRWSKGKLMRTKAQAQARFQSFPHALLSQGFCGGPIAMRRASPCLSEHVRAVLLYLAALCCAAQPHC